jgi:hypothetical protein
LGFSIGLPPPPPPAIHENAEAPPTGFERVAGALGLLLLLSAVADADDEVGVGGAPPLLEPGVAALTLRLTLSQRTGAGVEVVLPFCSNAEAAPWLLRRLNSPLDRDDAAGASNPVPLRAAGEDIETDF